MRNKFIALALVLFAFSAATYAQNMENGKAYIEVNGTAEKEVVPDEIYISITLNERYSGRNKITIEDQEHDLKQSLKSLGIDMADLSLSNADASYVRVNWFNKDVLAKKNYMLKVHNADMVGKVFHELGKLEIKDANIAKVDYSKKEELKKELRISAVKKAKEQATYMLQAIDEIVGKPLYIHENANYYYPMMANRMNVAKQTDNAEAVNQTDDYIEFKKMKFTSTVDARFEIK